jgi:hypothetical protein
MHLTLAHALPRDLHRHVYLREVDPLHLGIESGVKKLCNTLKHLNKEDFGALLLWMLCVDAWI